MKKLVLISFALGVSFLIASAMILSNVGANGLKQYVKDVIESKVKIVNQESYIEKEFSEEKFSDQMVLAVHASDADIELVKSEDGKLKLEYPQVEASLIRPLIEKDKITYNIVDYFDESSNTQWSVTMNEKEGNFSINAAARKHVRLHVPTKIKTVHIKTESGSIEVDNMLLSEVTLDSVSGDLKMKGVTAHKADLNTTSGDHRVSGQFDYLKVWSVSGALRFEDTEIAKELDANTVSGDINITGKGEPSAQIDAKSQSGDVRIKHPDFEIKDTGSVVGHQKKSKWQMRSVSGDIRVRYRDHQNSVEE